MDSDQLPLRDIHLPETIGWWPPAMGWWILVILIPLLFFLIFLLYKKLTRRSAIKTAKKMLEKIKQDTTSSDEQKLAVLSILLRRTAISVSSRSEAASLTGQDWLEFLDTPLNDQRFSKGIGTMLTDSRYQKQKPQLEIPPLITLCEDWLKALKRHQ